MNILVTGPSRGIGLGLVQAYAKRDDVTKIYACCKNPEGMWKHDKVEIIPLDVRNNQDIQKMKEQIKDVPIDILINNAGVYGFREEIDYDDMINTYNVNVLGVHRVISALVQNVQISQRKQIVGISSVAGSVGGRTRAGGYGYALSKSALNMLLKNFQLEYPDVNVLVLHPGWVQTDMGGDAAPITVDKSVQGLINVIDTQKEFGFFDFEHNPLVW